MTWKLLACFRGALAGSRAAPEQLVRERFREFQKLLVANEATLARMSALSDLVALEESPAYDGAEGLLREIVEQAQELVASVVRLSGGRYTALNGRVADISHEIHAALAGPPAPGGSVAAVRAAAASVVPLGLTDPHAANFAPRCCRTVHDVARFCHEMAIREMFEANKDIQRHRMSRARRLDYTVPLETFIIDLGGGLADGAAVHSIRPEDIASEPFRALVAGMSTPGLPWSRAVPIELGGFASLVINSMIDTERASAELGSDANVLVSEHYVNYSARMGYHFASLDAYACPSPHRNYLSYRFKGGAASAVRRVRRAGFIAHVLRHWGFAVVQRADHVDATLRKVGQRDALALLRELGRLLGAVRNADASMYCDAQIELYAEAFLAGACSPVDATRGKP